MSEADAALLVAAVWREESGRIIAGLARLTRDVGLAEDLAQEAVVAALEAWPRSGVPDNPGAWLVTTARHRAIDLMRRGQRLALREEQLARDLIPHVEAEQDALADRADGVVADDLLSLIFTCCHPVLSTEARVTLTLRMLGGLTTEEIARAFLTQPSTIGQRVSRAKRTLAEREVPFTVPRGPELAERLTAVLEVVYLIFNEGYTATAGEGWARPALCEDALRLARGLADLAPEQPEVHGLHALLELQASRLAARTAAGGEPLTLEEQDRDRWDLAAIGRGLRALDRAGEPEGPYALQAAIAACHARARRPHDTDWGRIAALYERLSERMRSPIVDLNRAVALGRAHGPEAGLELVDLIVQTEVLAGYHLLASVRGDLLEQLGRHDEAAAEFTHAAGQTENARERDLLRRRAQAARRGD